MTNFAKGFVDKKGYYDGKCATCENYGIDDIRSGYNDGFPCSIHFLKRLALDDSCSSYKKASYRDEDDIKKSFEALEKKYGTYRPHHYYIMTVICDLLGIDHYFYKLYLGLWFREEYLEKEGYEEFLKEYDEEGKQIAYLLANDESNVQIAYYLFNKYLNNFCNLVANKKYEEAFFVYNEMYKELKAKYINSNELVRTKKDVNKL